MLGWFMKGAEAGLPKAKFNVGRCLDIGEGVAIDYPAAADWYRRAAEGGHGGAAYNLYTMHAVGRGLAWQIVACHLIPPHCKPSFLE